MATAKKIRCKKTSSKEEARSKKSCG